MWYKPGSMTGRKWPEWQELILYYMYYRVWAFSSFVTVILFSRQNGSINLELPVLLWCEHAYLEFYGCNKVYNDCNTQEWMYEWRKIVSLMPFLEYQTHENFRKEQYIEEFCDGSNDKYLNNVLPKDWWQAEEICCIGHEETLLGNVI